MGDIQDKKPDQSDKPEAQSQETTNPFLEELVREPKSQARPQNPQDTSKSSTNQSDLPKFEIEDKKASKDSNGDKQSDAASESEQSKLGKYGPDKVLEAFAKAKELNVPVIVNRTMDHCASSQMVKKDIERYFKANSQSDTAPAVVVDLNYDKMNALKNEHTSMPDGPEKDNLHKELEQAYKLLNHGHGIFPEISKYDASDSTRPQANVMGYSGDAVKRLIEQKPRSGDNANADADRNSERTELSYHPQENKILKFSQQDLTKAVDYAKQLDLPLIVFTGMGLDANSKAAAYKVDELAYSFAREADPKAVVVKLDLLQLSSGRMRSGGELIDEKSLALAREMMGNVRTVPQITAYHPNAIGKAFDIINPNVESSNLYGKTLQAAKKAMESYREAH